MTLRICQSALALLILVAGTGESFNHQCEALGVDTALVVHTDSIDEYPAWSPDSRSLAVHIEGQWKEVKLDDLKLGLTKLHEFPIGIAEPSDLKTISSDKAEEWQKHSAHSPRVLHLPTGECLRLKQKDLSTALEITDRGGQSRILWKTDLENCHTLSLSPDQHYISYICELNGLVVSDARRLLAHPGNPVEEKDECSERLLEPTVYRFILPESYIGSVRIDFSARGAPELNDSKLVIIRVGQNGRFRTSSRNVDGWASPDMVRFEFFYDTPKGLRPVPDELVANEPGLGGFSGGGFWYFLVAPKVYRDKHPVDDFVHDKKPFPKTGRLNLAD